MSQSTSQINPPNAKEIQAWLIEQISEQLSIEPEEIDPQGTFESYSLDSAQAMSIVTKGEEILGFRPAPVLLWHYPTIESFSQRLAEEFDEMDSEILEI
jgi:acyl carrier protein